MSGAESPAEKRSLGIGHDEDERRELFLGLGALAAAVTGALTPEEVAQRAAAHLTHLVDTTAVTLYLWNDKTDSLEAIHVQGQEGIPTGLSVASGAGVAGRAFALGEPVVVEDFAAWEGATTALVEAGVIAAAAVPLFADGRAVGAVGIKFVEPPRSLPIQVAGLTLFASMVGPAIEAARARAEIRRQEEHSRSLLEGAADGIGMIDSNGRIVEANALLSQMLGYTHQEMLELGVRDIIAPSEFSDRPLGPESLESGWASRSERALVRRDGSQFPSEVSSVRLPDGSLQSIYRDITRRKGVEARIARLAAIVESSNDAIIASDLESSITSWNEGAEALFGYRADEAIGQSITLIMPPDQPSVLTSISAALDRGERIAFPELIRRRKDGTGVFVSATVSPVKDGAGNLVGRAAIYRDITEQRRSAEFLHASEARFRAIWETAEDGMIMLAPDGQVLSVNQRFADLFATKDGEIVGRDFEDFSTLMHRAIGEGAVAFTAPGQGVVSTGALLLDQQWPAQRSLQVVSTSVSGSAAEYLGQLYVFRDVTREREVDRMKTEFVSLVSHELRTPLTSIKGYVDLLLEDEVGTVPQEQRDFLQIIKNNADRLVTLIGDLLDVSRIEAGKVELKREPVDVGLSIAFVVESLRPQVESRDQRIVLDLAPALPLMSGDQDRLTQIFFNLLSNASKPSLASSTP